MKTILNKNGNFKNVSSIKTGETFIFNECLYLKIRNNKTLIQKSFKEKILAMDLKTGEIMIFYPEDTVIPVTAILTVNY